MRRWWGDGGAPVRGEGDADADGAAAEEDERCERGNGAELFSDGLDLEAEAEAEAEAGVEETGSVAAAAVARSLRLVAKLRMDSKKARSIRSYRLPARSEETKARHSSMASVISVRNSSGRGIAKGNGKGRDEGKGVEKRWARALALGPPSAAACAAVPIPPQRLSSPLKQLIACLVSSQTDMTKRRVRRSSSRRAASVAEEGGEGLSCSSIR
mmetsp:Transcript_16560/g.27367  ORF Transcript_16560/g.27367 Transcript_16560/m.27367 type:complete len:213 (-) Transcript_16560:1308-1946(-)